MTKIYYVALFLFCFGCKVWAWRIFSLWCYQCVSTQPGCGDTWVDWRIHHAITCPRSKDKCVKIIETKGANTFIIRDCLSNIEGLRQDIPADTYEGCRPAASQPKLAVYVENSIPQIDVKRAYYDDVKYCFCEFDQWCNGVWRMKTSWTMTAAMITIVLWLQHRHWL